ncbi:MAG TPA: MAPEG family protein [Allosphingosinicella sp.]|nr:MAPEG family protein [Allosphingosinicella sp.]
MSAPAIMLPITLTMAGAATLLNFWLGGRIGRMRVAHKVSIGDGGVEPLVRRMRAQANYIENMPFFLILLGLVEMASGSSLWLWIVGALFIVARILHGLGMDQPSPSRLRMIGMVSTALLLLGLALYALALPYLHPWPRTTITYASPGTPGESSGGTNES